MMDSNISKIRRLVSDWPEHISYDKNNSDVSSYYDKYKGYPTNPESFFYNKRHLDIFIYAMSIGKHYGKKSKLKDRSNSLPVDALKEDEIWLMIATALSESDTNLEILKDGKKIVQICEEYANAGITYLIDTDKQDGFMDTFRDLSSISK